MHSMATFQSPSFLVYALFFILLLFTAIYRYFKSNSNNILFSTNNYSVKNQELNAITIDDGAKSKLNSIIRGVFASNTSEISFRHANPYTGQYNCEPGFEPIRFAHGITENIDVGVDLYYCINNTLKGKSDPLNYFGGFYQTCQQYWLTYEGHNYDLNKANQSCMIPNNQFTNDCS